MNPNKPMVVARLTAERADGTKIIVEVWSGATFSQFFHYFTQQGRKRSTKQHGRTANRNEALVPTHRAYCMQPGLAAISARMESSKQFKSVNVRIIKRRAYKQLINTSPDQLGLASAGSLGLSHNVRSVTSRLPLPKAIPVTQWLADLKLKREQVSQ